MDENQEQFISWIAAKLQASDETDLQKKLKALGDQGIKQAYDQFLQEGVQKQAEGGKLEYIKCLDHFKKGGKMKMGCGCSGMKLPMAKEKGGKMEASYKGKSVEGLDPHKVKMGQGVDGVLGGKPLLKRQTGGTIQPNALKGNTGGGEQVQSPSKQQGQMNMGPSPEEVEKQKVNEKSDKILNSRNGVGVQLTPMEILMEQIRPKQIKAKPEKKITLISKNDTIYGIDR